jgi:hypothetical protein
LGGLGVAAGAVTGTALAAAPYYGGYYGCGYCYDSGYGGDGYGSGYGYPSYTAYGYSSPYDGQGYGYNPSYYRYASRPYSRYRHYYASARPVYRAQAKRLMTVPGIGPVISTATVAAIGNGDVFSKCRDFGAWLGLVP